MDLQKEFFACLAIRHTPFLGPKGCRELLAAYPSVFEAVHRVEEWSSRKLVHPRAAKGCREEVWREKAEREYKLALIRKMDVVTWFDPRFPDSLKTLPDPPILLYVRGDVSLLKNPSVAIVGARQCTPLGLQTAGSISAQLSKVGVTVVSGLALGIDRQAHLGGLKGLGSTIGVLGCGLDINYPEENLDVRLEMEERGLVVTEFGPGVPPRGQHFPVRNRIVSGLSLGTLVAEAAHNSGSLITARLAGEQGRDVFAVPGPIGQATFTGCHRLIKQGAALVENAVDIIEILRFDFARELERIPDPDPVSGEEVDLDDAVIGKTPGKKKKQTKERVRAADPHALRKRAPLADRESMRLSEEERKVLALLDKTDKMHIDVLGRTLGWDSPAVSRILLGLEMCGAVQQLPGMWYLVRES